MKKRYPHYLLLIVVAILATTAAAAAAAAATSVSGSSDSSRSRSRGHGRGGENDDDHNNNSEEKRDFVLERKNSTTTTTTSSVIELTSSNEYDNVLKTSYAVFIHFYAPWAVWCQRLAPTWEEFAQKVQNEEHLPVTVAEIDCVTQADLCRNEQIRAFPTLRWYKRGVAASSDYKMDRTVNALMGYAKSQLNSSNNDLFDVTTANDHSEDKEESEDYKDEATEGDDEIADEENGEEEEPMLGFENVGTAIEERCKAAYLPYGSDNQRFSESGSVEYDDFSGLRFQVAPTCKSAGSNPRGKYNSFYAPCEFQFHVVPRAKNTRSMQLSTVCSKDNVYRHTNRAGDDHTSYNEAVMDYVRGWPDECVGDYTRCYSVTKQSEAKIFLPHFCRNNWDIPTSVTHVSVTCEDDKNEALKKQRDRNDIGNIHLAQMDKHHREKVTAVLGVVLLAFCCCWVCLCLGYSYVVVPYLKSIKRSKSDPDLQALVNQNQKEDDERQIAKPIRVV